MSYSRGWDCKWRRRRRRKQITLRNMNRKDHNTHAVFRSSWEVPNCENMTIGNVMFYFTNHFTYWQRQEPFLGLMEQNKEQRMCIRASTRGANLLISIARRKNARVWKTWCKFCIKQSWKFCCNALGLLHPLTDENFRAGPVLLLAVFQTDMILSTPSKRVLHTQTVSHIERHSGKEIHSRKGSGGESEE